MCVPQRGEDLDGDETAPGIELPCLGVGNTGACWRDSLDLQVADSVARSQASAWESSRDPWP